MIIGLFVLCVCPVDGHFRVGKEGVFWEMFNTLFNTKSVG